MTSQLADEPLDADSAAAYARVSLSTIYRAARKGTLRGTKPGNGQTTAWRFRRDDLDRWVEGLPPRKGGAA